MGKKTSLHKESQRKQNKLLVWRRKMMEIAQE